MKKKISIILTVLFITTYAFALTYGVYFYSDTTKYANAEKTAAGPQQLVAAVSGKSILVRSISMYLDAAGSVYCYQGTDPSKRILMPTCDHDGDFFFRRIFPISDINKSTLPALDASKALMIWTSTDPDEGHVEVEYEYSNT